MGKKQWFHGFAGWLLLASSLFAAGAAWAGAQAVAASGQVGTLKFERHGDHGRAVILIPGLEGGPWVWKDTIAQLEKNHVVYAVTLAGFDGMPAPARKTGLMDQADTSLLALIGQQHIDKPVLVGHSLGGTLALRFAGEHPALISGAVAVDGLPVFPGMDRVDAVQRQAIAERARTQMAAMTPAQFQAAALGYMQHVGTIDPKLAAQYAPMNARSDIAASAEYAAEDMTADYRPLLRQADVPVLEISPYYAPDFAKPPLQLSETQKAAYYQGLLANAPQAKVVSIAPARHFVMLDQPEKFRTVLTGFLDSL
ncbi:alpha/beta fold hydrolase [Rhodanobacter sp. Si-c]|uniref:Alpha/beta fold hydrolase n=1 Tax=Rhodanobacter lycopersici TaxID=3162487 RepID=A0ABV3QDZ4_9GAMM